MWHNPIVNYRITTALEEGITSQSVARSKRDHSRKNRSRGDSYIRRLIDRIRCFWIKEPRQTRATKKIYGLRQSEGC